MELDDLKAAWQEMSNQVAAQGRLTERLVLNSIRQKSNDVIEDMRSGLECMLAGLCIAFLLPLVWALRSADGMVTAGALIILGLVTVNGSIAWRLHRALGTGQDGGASVREALQEKLKRIRAFYSWGRSYGLLISLLIYATGVVTYLTFRYGYVRVTNTDLIVYGSLAVFMIVSTQLLTRRHEASVSNELESCLQELDGFDAATRSSSRSRDLLAMLFAACVVALSVAIVLLTWNQAAR